MAGLTPDYLERNQAYAKPGPYRTALPPEQEAKFQAYLADKSDPQDIGRQDGPDYDMRGWWRGMLAGDPKAAIVVDPNDKLKHRNDYWKTPYHPTFSNESQWATPSAPHWDGDKLIDQKGNTVFEDKPEGKARGGAMKRADGGHVSQGYLHGSTPGRADAIKTAAPAASYVIPADVVSGMGEGNSTAGAKRLQERFGAAPTRETKSVPVMLSHGEFVITPEKVKEIGGGNSKNGFKVLDHFVLEMRKRHIAKLKKLPPPAK